MRPFPPWLLLVYGWHMSDDPRYSSVPRMHYELPDGKTVPVGPQRFQVPDILMNPEPVMGMLTGTTPATTYHLRR